MSNVVTRVALIQSGKVFNRCHESILTLETLFSPDLYPGGWEAESFNLGFQLSEKTKKTTYRKSTPHTPDPSATKQVPPNSKYTYIITEFLISPLSASS